jgi:DMSO/TMAO reductase YedYZ molybdopterin-dependent catalytic subunit
MIIRKDPKIRFPNPDPSRVPPGQFVTQQWPVLHFGSIPRVDLPTWKFSAWGEVENPAALRCGS